MAITQKQRQKDAEAAEELQHADVRILKRALKTMMPVIAPTKPKKTRRKRA